MRFLYSYRTSDNLVHDGEVRATDSDAAYALLKKSGIRPSRLVEAPGFFNKLFGKGKRWMAIVVLAIVAAGALCGSFRKGEVCSEARRQLVGDAAILDEGLESGWARVLPDDGDRWLAMFAQPGRVPRNGLQRACPLELFVVVRELKRSMDVAPEILPDDIDEYRQLKSIVKGLKKELRKYIEEGGSVPEYLQFLEKRQNDEREKFLFHESRLKELVAKGVYGRDLRAAWEKENDELRSLNLPALKLPKEAM